MYTMNTIHLTTSFNYWKREAIWRDNGSSFWLLLWRLAINDVTYEIGLISDIFRLHFCTVGRCGKSSSVSIYLIWCCHKCCFKYHDSFNSYYRLILGYCRCSQRYVQLLSSPKSFFLSWFENSTFIFLLAQPTFYMVKYDKHLTSVDQHFVSALLGQQPCELKSVTEAIPSSATILVANAMCTNKKEETWVINNF